MQVLDATPGYLYFPLVPERVSHAYVDQPLKFVILLRDPVDRAHSMYKMAEYELTMHLQSNQVCFLSSFVFFYMCYSMYYYYYFCYSSLSAKSARELSICVDSDDMSLDVNG